MIEVKASVLRNLAIPHLRNAIKRHFSIKKIEIDNTGKPYGPFFEDILDDWISCILSCGGAADTFVNDCMKEVDFGKENQENLRTLNLMSRTKYFLKDALDIKIDVGAPVFQQMKIVYDLRSAVMHYRPHWSDEYGISQELESKMPKCEPNPFVPEGDTFFPLRCVSSGYSRWAVESTIAYVNKLFELGDFKRAKGSFKNLEEMFERG